MGLRGNPFRSSLHQNHDLKKLHQRGQRDRGRTRPTRSRSIDRHSHVTQHVVSLSLRSQSGMGIAGRTGPSGRISFFILFHGTASGKGKRDRAKRSHHYQFFLSSFPVCFFRVLTLCAHRPHRIFILICLYYSTIPLVKLYNPGVSQSLR
jgi:hypothetical protein